MSSVAGFSQYNCTSDLQSANHVSFWCHYSAGDGAAIMIGGGGTSCGGSGHGIAITKADIPQFSSRHSQYDFGDDASRSQTSSYALNLWIR